MTGNRQTSGRSDLHVEPISDALSGWSLDVVVSGSIGAVESVRFVRALRRLGAKATPWLTRGGAQFVTPTALAWAAGTEVRQDFAGDASHIALGDAVVVAPASASLIGKLAHGITDTPAAALVTSYLGQGKPVLLLPNMHDSLADAPAVHANLAKLAAWGVVILGARLEEDKRKFPEPAVLADHVAHRLRRERAGTSVPVLVTMGTTRGYIDSVRYISNYSSGALGSQIAEELFRLGFDTHVVAGPCPVRPHAATRLVAVETNAEMQAAAADAVAQGAQAAVLAASVLDFAPKERRDGKISSKTDGLTVELVTTPKIIAGVRPTRGVKVGFKLETGLTPDRARALADDYVPRYGLTLMVINDLSDVDASRHRAFVFEAAAPGQAGAAPVLVEGKAAVARAVAAHVAGRLRQERA